MGGGFTVDGLEQPPPPQAVPIGCGAQVPAIRLQVRQGPAQAWLQQTPPVQNPEAHWLAALQALPLGCPALAQLPFRQTKPAWQSPSLMQLVRQAPF